MRYAINSAASWPKQLLVADLRHRQLVIRLTCQRKWQACLYCCHGGATAGKHSPADGTKASENLPLVASMHLCKSTSCHKQLALLAVSIRSQRSVRHWGQLRRTCQTAGAASPCAVPSRSWHLRCRSRARTCRAPSSHGTRGRQCQTPPDGGHITRWQWQDRHHITGTGPIYLWMTACTARPGSGLCRRFECQVCCNWSLHVSARTSSPRGTAVSESTPTVRSR